MEEKTLATLAKAVKRHRQAKGMTQRQLAQKVSLAPDTISLIERAGQPNIGLRNLAAIAGALGVEAYELLLEDPEAVWIKLIVSDANLARLERLVERCGNLRIAVIKK